MPTISCSCSALGALGQLLTEETGTAPRTFSPTSLRHEFVYETLGTERNLQSTNTVTGNLANLASSVREKSYLTTGQIAIQPSPAQLSVWLPRIFGGPLVGTDVALSNNPPSFDCLVYRENGIFQYTDAVVSQAMLQGKTANGGEELEFMSLIVAIVGKEELINPGAWPLPEPALPTTIDYLPFTFWETELVLNGIDVEYESIKIMVNNKLDVKFFNKPFPSCIRATGRDIKIGIDAPFTCNNLTEALSLNTTAGTGQFSMASGNMSTVLDFPAIRNAFKTPTIKGKQTIPLEFNLEAYAPTTAGINVVITHDATP